MLIKGWRFFWITGIGLIIVLLVAYFFYGLQPTLNREGSVLFKISKNESFRNIASRLSQENLIKSIAVLKVYSVLAGKVQKFQPGIHTLNSDMSIPQIVGALTEKGKNELTITIIEGMTVKDIDIVLVENGIVKEGEFLNYNFEELSKKYPFLQSINSLEGFLFPDTYRFEIGVPVKEILSKFLDNFYLKAWPILEGRKNWYDELILASYLEKEVPEFNDRTLIAGILLKRLRNSIPLQIDATLTYAKCNGLFVSCLNSAVQREDLQISSPYNTYQRLGWTPTPIANSGQSAVKAAVSPEESPYFYYLSASKTKKTIFSKTLEEHNQNRAKYL